MNARPAVGGIGFLAVFFNPQVKGHSFCPRGHVHTGLDDIVGPHQPFQRKACIRRIHKAGADIDYAAVLRGAKPPTVDLGNTVYQCSVRAIMGPLNVLWRDGIHRKTVFQGEA
jgi:hypothetical protein